MKEQPKHFTISLHIFGNCNDGTFRSNKHILCDSETFSANRMNMKETFFNRAHKSKLEWGLISNAQCEAVFK